jgi:hypothetical protein
VIVLTSGFGQFPGGEQPGVRLDGHVRLEPVLAAVDGLVHVPGLRIHHTDDPILGHLAGDAPPAVGAVGTLGRPHRRYQDECPGLPPANPP